MRGFLDSLLQMILYYSGINALYMMLRGNHLVVLGYHSISDPTHRVGQHADVYRHLSVSGAVFEKQMKFLQDNGYVFLRFSDLLAIRKGERALPHRAALIYFDDGYEDNYVHAYPILKRLGIPATVFVVTDCVDQKMLLWETNLDPATAHMFLTWEDVRAMSGVFDVGTHTVTHRKLTGLKTDEIRKELMESRKRIREMTGKEVIALSFPKSRWTQEIRRIAEEIGFEFILAYGRGFRHSADFRSLEKIPVGPLDSWLAFQVKVGAYYPVLRLLGK